MDRSCGREGNEQAASGTPSPPSMAVVPPTPFRAQSQVPANSGTSKPRSARELSLCERLHPGWSGFDSPLVCAGTPRLFRLPAAHAGRHPQRHRGAAGKSVRAPDSLFGGGVPFTSGIFQLPRNHGLRLWRRLPQKNGDERLGGPQRLRSLAHPGIFVPEEEKSFHT